MAARIRALCNPQWDWKALVFWPSVRRLTLNKDGLAFLPGGGTIVADSLSLRTPGVPGGLDAAPSALMLLGEGDKRGIELFLDRGRPQIRLYDSSGQLSWAMPEDKRATSSTAPLEPPAHSNAIPPNPFTNPDPQARLPHPACPTCYFYKGSYQVYEDVPGVPPPRGILSRDIPNPAPGYPQGVQRNARGEPTYYVGTQMMIGPTDEAPVSPTLPHSLIALQRIQVRHEHKVMTIPGVHGFRHWGTGLYGVVAARTSREPSAHSFSVGGRTGDGGDHRHGASAVTQRLFHCGECTWKASWALAQGESAQPLGVVRSLTA